MKTNKMILLMSMLFVGSAQASEDGNLAAIQAFVLFGMEKIMACQNQNIFTENEKTLLTEENAEKINNYLGASLKVQKDVDLIFSGLLVVGLVNIVRDDAAGVNFCATSMQYVGYAGVMGQMYYRHKLWQIRKRLEEEIVEPNDNEESVTLDVESQSLLSRQSHIDELDRKRHGNNYERASFENK